MKLQVCGNKAELGARASANAIQTVREALVRNGLASIVVATGTSQFDLLQNLSASKDIDWSRVVMFHLDEYIDLPETHPASFRKYLKERFISKLPALKACYLIDGDATDPAKECERVERFIQAHKKIDIAILGLGMNGHIGMNEPGTSASLRSHVSKLDPQTQEVGQKYFKSKTALTNGLTLGMATILEAKHIFLLVSGAKKASIAGKMITEEISEQLPCTLLRNHTGLRIYLDKEAATQLPPNYQQ